MRLGKIRWFILALLVLFLIVAWYDGGREEPRLIEQPVSLQDSAE